MPFIRQQGWPPYLFRHKKPAFSIKMALASLFFGALYPLGFAPISIWPLTLLSLMGLAWQLHSNIQKHFSVRSCFWIGFFYGIGLFGVGISWISVSFSYLSDWPKWIGIFPTLAFACFLSIFTGLFSMAFSRFLMTRQNLNPFVFASFWVLSEMLRGVLFTGFPWLNAGYALTQTWIARFYAPIVGQIGLSWLLAFSAVLMLNLLRQLKKSHQSPQFFRQNHALPLMPLMQGFFILVFIGLPLTLPPIDWTQASSKPFRFALIQPSIEQKLKWDPDHAHSIRRQYKTLTEQALASSFKPQLIIWPEAAIPDFFDAEQNYILNIDALIHQHKAEWILGLLTRFKTDDDMTYHNSVLGLGQTNNWYHKQKLVPFGEFIPFADWFSKSLPILNTYFESFDAGPHNQPAFITSFGQTSPLICYEIVYADFVRQRAENSHWLLTLSNDAWFGKSLGPYQHLEIAQMRSIELGRYLVRSTNSGVSALVDHRGQILKKTGLFTSEILEGEITPMIGQTPFAKWGNMPTGIMICLTLIYALIRCWPRNLR
jgi:apolipoprotein N-acyltransferase